MNRPRNIPTYEEVDLKLGIKSSLPHVKSSIAMSILFWECDEQPAELEYSVSEGNGIKIRDELLNSILRCLENIFSEREIDLDKVTDMINQNQLFKSQMEALMVAFELIWKLAKVSFCDISKPSSAERTGMIRYPKKLIYTSNIDILHSVIQNNKVEYIKVLLSWIGINIEYNREFENSLISVLNILAENAIFKLNDGSKEIIFNQNSIYSELMLGSEKVDIKGDKDARGSLRILKSLLSEEMNPYLDYSNGKVSLKNNDNNNFENYSKRVETLAKISNVKITSGDEVVKQLSKRPFTDYKSRFSRNRIIFGAPGTGKSYQLNKEREELLKDGNEENYERVTFHPDYSYANFVGTYKPVAYEKEDGEEGITYEYVPGPFMRIYVEAIKNSGTDNIKPYLLLVEEINRANVAAVFGDIFQLLDRGNDHVSEYPIEASEDIKKYLARKLGGTPSDYRKIYIPDNMFIWATMNSADQGVFPMDTAFKRRWDFDYLGINEKEQEIAGRYVVLGKGEYKRKVEWNKLRKAINNKLSELKVNEDKLIGPYFLSTKVIEANDNGEINNQRFIPAFKGKVLMYLFEDAARQRRNKLFETNSDNIRYSEICTAFDEKGVKIFDNDISSEFENDKIEEDNE